MKQYDLLVIGSGPGGQKAAIGAVEAGYSVALVEEADKLGGSSLLTGMIPAKMLRENALNLQAIKRHADAFQFSLKKDIMMTAVSQNLDKIIHTHSEHTRERLQGVTLYHGRARFVSGHAVEVHGLKKGEVTSIEANHIVIATGSKPLELAQVPVNDEGVFDSHSIHSLHYLPRDFMVVGSGLIACVYASIFAALGVKVTLVDPASGPLSFLDDSLVEEFLVQFKNSGGRYLKHRTVKEVVSDKTGHVTVTLSDDVQIRAEKILIDVGRRANLDMLQPGNAGLKLNVDGFLSVDEHGRTAVPHIYVVGDATGQPPLSSLAMVQGRLAIAHICGTSEKCPKNWHDIHISTIPELASIGLTENQAIEVYGAALTGRVSLSESDQGAITGVTDGFLKLVCQPGSRRLLGVQVAGRGAAELIHMGEMGLLRECNADFFLEDIFDTPTYAEVYRLAALKIC